MSKNTVVDHPQGRRFIKTEKFFLDMFPNDPCAACLLSVFEWKVNHVAINRDPKCRPEEKLLCDPESVRLSLSLTDFEEELLGTYRRQAIFKSLQTLESAGFIEINRSPGGGRPNEYRLLVGNLNSALKNRQYENILPEMGQYENILPQCEIILPPQCEIILPLIRKLEEEELQERTEESIPLTPFSNSKSKPAPPKACQPEQPEPAGTAHPSCAADRSATAEIQRLTSDVATAEWVCDALRARFGRISQSDVAKVDQTNWEKWSQEAISSSLTSWKGSGGHQAREFLSRLLGEPLMAKFNSRPASRPLSRSSRSSWPGTASAPPGSSSGVHHGAAIRGEEKPPLHSQELENWDQAFRSSAPAVSLPDSVHHKLLAECMRDPEFLANSKKLAEKLQAIHLGPPKGWKPTPLWAFNFNDDLGARNWHKVVCGEYDGMAVKPSAPAKLSLCDLAIQKIRDRRVAHEAAEAAAAQ